MQSSNSDFSFYCTSSYTEADLIREYYEVYILPVLNFLRTYYKDNELCDLLSASLTKSPPQFQIDLDQIIDCKQLPTDERRKIKSVLSVLQQLLTGNLTRDSTLMASLLKATRGKNVEDLNALVKQHITLSLLFPEPESSADNNITEATDIKPN